jgi:hypothetical protein
VQASGRRRRLEIKPAPSGHFAPILAVSGALRCSRNRPSAKKQGCDSSSYVCVIYKKILQACDIGRRVHFRPPLLAMYLASDVDAELE